MENHVSYEAVETRPLNQSNKHLSEFGKVWIIALVLTAVSFVIGYVLGSNVKECRSDDLKIYHNFETLSSQLQTLISTNFMEEQFHIYSSEIHQSGSSKNLDLADVMDKNWKNWGLQFVNMYHFYANRTFPNLQNYSTVQLLQNGKIIWNVTTMDFNGTLPVYHSYSPNGVAKGRFVFINYGLAEDLNKLKELNVTFCGSKVIPIVRLGFGFRSEKVQNLVKFCKDNLPGGLLVYPDPWDFAVDSSKSRSTPDNTAVYPDTWWLPGDAAVFGNMRMSFGLQTDNLPLLDNIIPAIPFSKMETPFPVQPLSYNDTKQLFKCLSKTPIPENWISLAKYLESDNCEISMNINNYVGTAKLANVIGQIPGSVESDRYVIIGNHRDAWVYGAQDPGSGTVLLQQIAKILGEAYHKGNFIPTRSIIFASWDGEEEGLIGSREFTNQFAYDLRERCVAYINIDSPIKGNWSFKGRASPLMSGPMLSSSHNVKLDSGLTLFDDWLNKRPSRYTPGEPTINDLGGGSDHMVFEYTLGIPSIYPEYTYNYSIPNPPSYHTKYDNIDMLTRFIDPSLKSHKTVAKFLLDTVIRFSSSPLIPYSVGRLADSMIIRFSDLQKKLNVVEFLKLSNYSEIIRSDLQRFKSAADTFENSIKVQTQSLLNDRLKLRQINDILLSLPRYFAVEDGLPHRSYFKNILLSPKLQNAYLGSMFTGVIDAVDLYESHSVNISMVYKQVSLLINSLRSATNILKGGLVNILYKSKPSYRIF